MHFGSGVHISTSPPTHAHISIFLPFPHISTFLPPSHTHFHNSTFLPLPPVPPHFHISTSPPLYFTFLHFSPGIPGISTFLHFNMSTFVRNVGMRKCRNSGVGNGRKHEGPPPRILNIYLPLITINCFRASCPTAGVSSAMHFGSPVHMSTFLPPHPPRTFPHFYIYPPATPRSHISPPTFLHCYITTSPQHLHNSTSPPHFYISSFISRHFHVVNFLHFFHHTPTFLHPPPTIPHFYICME